MKNLFFGGDISMGERILKAFQMAREAGGATASMRLAAKGGMSSTKAKDEPDSPELIKKFEEALAEILGKPVSL
jgi:hypothetical protein